MNGDSRRDAIALDIFPHALSLLARVTDGDIGELEWRVDRPCAGEWRASTESGGATVSLTISMAGRPTTNQLRLIGARGTVHVDLFHGFAIREGPSVSRARKLTQPFAHGAKTLAAASGNLLRRAARRERAYPGLRELVLRFHAAAASGFQPPLSAKEILAVARARDAIRRAANDASNAHGAARLLLPAHGS